MNQEIENTTLKNLEVTFDYVPSTPKVRIFGTKENPLFVAKDVCDVLGLTNVSKASKSLKDSQKGITSSHTLGGEQNLLYVTESGLYRLIFKSRKPEAEAFCDWICEEVLPSIRKNGFYGNIPPDGMMPVP